MINQFVYAYRLLNRIEHNYNTTKRDVLTMVFALHKFKHYLLGNKFVFYVDHMALVYLVNKPQVSGRIIRWLLLFLKYDFTIMYKAKQNSCNCKYVVKTTRCYITHRCTRLNHKCKFVLHIAKMVE